MTEPQVTWSVAHHADYQARLLEAYRHVYRAHAAAPLDVRRDTTALLDKLRERMDNATRLQASQWERAFYKREMGKR
jgi:hypothetical protein